MSYPYCTRLCYFYPRSPCGERPGTIGAAAGTAAISIHALLAESDNLPQTATNMQNYFYPRSPCGERPHIHSTSHGRPGISIHALLAESDCWAPRTPGPNLYFYPRSPCGERPYGALKHVHEKEISIHALLAESDVGGAREEFAEKIFLSTLSLRRATSFIIRYSFVKIYFYPRSPCGERPPGPGPEPPTPGFLSTLSLRRATGQQSKTSTAQRFLSTLSLRRATPPVTRRARNLSNFYPRSPCGERRFYRCRVRLQHKYFYPRSPCGERPSNLASLR